MTSTDSPRAGWQNWSGRQRHQPVRVVTPADGDALAHLVRETASRGGTLRCVGSGHSFVPFWTDDTLVSLDAFSGVIDVDPERRLARVGAGSKLYALGPALWRHGLSLPQQGDIDRQSLAGAIATGTHGTGRTLHSLSNAVRAVTLVDARGETLQRRHCDPDFPALQLGLGLFGVITEVTLALEPAYHLHERLWESDVEGCGEALAGLVADNRHFEFFWTPRSDRCAMKTLNPTDGAEADAADGERIGPAWAIFPSERDIRFNEMEFAVPFDAGWACFSELREALLARFPRLPWPVEYRTLGADALPLSPATRADAVTLSVHQGAERDPGPLFDVAEAIFRNHRGRPHWGKLHSHGAADFAGLYPHFDAFCAQRHEADPEGLFLNDYLAGLFAGR